MNLSSPAVWRCLSALLVILACESGDSAREELPEPLILDPDLTIGLVEGDPNYLFGSVAAVAADAQGRIFVSDRIGGTVRVYDKDGRFIALVARQGGGPGEVDGWAADIAPGPEGTMYIRDGSRITVLTPRIPGAVADSVAAVWPTVGYGHRLMRGRAVAAGEYYYPNGYFPPGEPPQYFYQPVRDGVVGTDTLKVPPYPNLSALRPSLYRLAPSDALMIPGLSHTPFAPLPVWDVTEAGSLLSSDGTQYTIFETTSSGGTLQVITRPTHEVRLIPAPEKEDSARALASRIDKLRVPLADVTGIGEGVREGRLPSALPALIGLHVSADGMIWVEQWPTPGQGHWRFFDVLEKGGTLSDRLVLRASLSRDPPPFFGAGVVIGVVTDSATDVERIVRFTKPGQPQSPSTR